MGAAQTRKPLKRLDLNFKLFGLTCDVNHNLPTLTKNRSDLDYVFNCEINCDGRIENGR